MLRLLYRIRHSNSKSKSKSRDQQPRITPNDLSVICISSKRGRPTYERKLITDDGDFSESWPEGFFEERDGELF